MQRKGRRTQRASISHRPTTLALAAGCRIPMRCGCGICPGEGSCEHLPHLPAPGPQQLIPRAMTLGSDSPGTYGTNPISSTDQHWYQYTS